MWKYVTRRIRDTVEKTYNVLDVRVNWAYGSETANNVNSTSAGQKNKRNCSLWNQPEPNCGSKSSSSDERKYTHWTFPRQFFDVFVVANAVLFTWYGRRECLARRKLRGLDSKVRHRCRFALIPYKPSQSAPLVLSAPGATPGAASDATSTHSNAPVCVEPEHGFKSNDFLNIYTHRVHRLSNEHDSVQSTNRRSTSVQATTESLIDNIIRQLVYLQGRVEFNLAMENIAAKNLPDAVSNLRAATSHHHLDAAFNLGLCYELGMGVKKDMKMAMECYRQAARRGHIKANYNLGVFYARGLGGLKKDARAARECFVTAATMGLAEAKILVATDKAQTKAAQKSDESLEDGYQSNPSPIISNIMAHKDLWNLIMGDNQLAMEKKRDNGGLKRKKFPSDSTDEGYKSDPSPFIHSSNDELFLSLIDAKQN